MYKETGPSLIRTQDPMGQSVIVYKNEEDLSVRDTIMDSYSETRVISSVPDNQVMMECIFSSTLFRLYTFQLLESKLEQWDWRLYVHPEPV